MKTISLTKGKSTIVDNEDYDYLMQWKWFFAQGYAKRSFKREDGKWRQKMMHRVIANTPDGMETDHRNLDKLDNRRLNLRNSTPTQNRMNRGVRGDSGTGVKGVFREPGRKGFRAAVRYNGKLNWLGTFPTSELAHAAYSAAAKIHHGEFARTS